MVEIAIDRDEEATFDTSGQVLGLTMAGEDI
jgi:hypothetical protein